MRKKLLAILVTLTACLAGPVIVPAVAEGASTVKTSVVDYGKYGTFKITETTVNGVTHVQGKRVTSGVKARASVLYNSSTYLHTSNAAYYCRQWNNSSANTVMLGATGYPIYWITYDYGNDPWDSNRGNNNYVGIVIKFNSNPQSYYYVLYGCGVQGSDNSWSFYTIFAGSPQRS